MLNIKADIPSSFFDEENREGYLVSSEMKKVWAIQIDLLMELLRVCKKYDIKIFASGGTMLGTVRHKGYIPWDDDIDMMMYREDYIKLCNVPMEEWKHPYFFQTEYTDTGSMRGHAQLRNVETTCILKTELGKEKYIQGIFVDIFPLDTVTDNEIKWFFQMIRARIYRKIAWVQYHYVETSELMQNNIKTKFLHYFWSKVNNFCSFDWWYSKFENECQRYNADCNSKYISTLSLKFEEKLHFKYRSDYQEFTTMPFEMIEMPIAVNYQHALDKRYPGWNKPVKIGNTHGEIIISATEDYKSYLRRNGINI